MIQIRQVITAITTEPTRQTLLTNCPKSIADTPLNGAAIDSRQVAPGCLFVALPGERTDGHNYVAKAFENGAAVAIVEKEITGFPTIDLTTGTESELA